MSSGRKYLLHSGIFLLTSVLGSGTVALCEDDKDNDIFSKIKNSLSNKDHFMEYLDDVARDVGSKIQNAVDTGVPNQLSYGFVCGFCSGFSLKKAGKVVAIVFGFGFVTLQTLSYAGYIKVDQEKIKNDVERIMDLNNDGNVDSDDTTQLMDKVIKVLSFNLPAGGGFGAGFIGGLRSG